MAKINFDKVSEYLIDEEYDLLKSDRYTVTYFKEIDHTCSVQVFIDFLEKIIDWKVVVDSISNKKELQNVMKAYDMLVKDKKGLKEFLNHE